ncbi:MAG TPA: hypothetical protein VEB63_01985 [Chitinophagaceae bacterium]|nr:hypothetical protein [Chitinophagaceae bacterium]
MSLLNQQSKKNRGKGQKKAGPPKAAKQIGKPRSSGGFVNRPGNTGSQRGI